MSAIFVVVYSDTDPIAGTVSDGQGATTRFVGYAHLVAEIERHRDPLPAAVPSALAARDSKRSA